MDRQRCDIHRVAAQCGVQLMDAARHSITGRHDRQCFCKPTLRRIGRRHGEGHLALVLRLIVESEGNAGELFSATIEAVSNVLLSNLVTVDAELFAAFDQIDLGELRIWALAAKGEASAADFMTAALLWQLASPDVVLGREAA
jgi:hypothetical protein